MPSGHRWKCSGCNSYFYTLNRRNNADTLVIPEQFCEDEEDYCEATYSRSIKNLQPQHSPILDTVAASRKRRLSRTDTSKRAKKMQKQIGNEELDPEDTEYAQQMTHFKAEMRLTTAVRVTVIPRGRACVLNMNKLVTVQIGAPAPRGNQTTTMGGRQAWAIAGRADYGVNKFLSSEWCHLQGAALGGPTTANNLVSASFAANSEMYFMEMLLKGKTDLYITVKVYVTSMNGDEADVAEYIKYIIRANNARNKLQDYVRWIDGRSDGFSEHDANALKDELRIWLKANRKAFAVNFDNIL